MGASGWLIWNWASVVGGMASGFTLCGRGGHEIIIIPPGSLHGFALFTISCVLECGPRNKSSHADPAR